MEELKTFKKKNLRHLKKMTDLDAYHTGSKKKGGVSRGGWVGL